MAAPLDRRQFAAAAALAVAALPALAREGDNDCPKCGGVGLVPLKDPPAYVWIEGQPAPKPEQAVRGAPCPECRPDTQPADLVELERERLKTAHDSNALWEKRCGGKLLRVEARHGALHTLVVAAEAARMGAAMEALAAHLQKLTSSLVLTPTTPDTYDLFVLWEKRSYDHFRTVLEKHYAAEELGPFWPQTREAGGYDFQPAPFFYEDPITARLRPPTHGTVFFLGRRMLSVATGHAAPIWLLEGFAAYSEHAVLKRNRWSTIYDPGQQAANADWLFEVRRLGIGGKLRSLADLFALELRDYAAADYVQAFGVVKFLLETDPTRFLRFVRHMRDGRSPLGALEAATEVSVERLEKPWARWLRQRS